MNIGNAFKEELNELVSKRTGINIAQNSLMNSDFFSNEIDMHPRDLMLLLYDIEMRYGVRFDDEFLLSGKFNNFSNIYKYLVNEQIRKEENNE